jgi:hypothetical protein
VRAQRFRAVPRRAGVNQAHSSIFHIIPNFQLADYSACHLFLSWHLAQHIRSRRRWQYTSKMSVSFQRTTRLISQNVECYWMLIVQHVEWEHRLICSYVDVKVFQEFTRDLKLAFVVRKVYDVRPAHIDETITCGTSLKVTVPLLRRIDVGVSQRKWGFTLNAI